MLRVLELERKTGGDVNMKQQFSEFVQAMHALPWQQLRESLDQDQLEELFKVLANVPETIDQVHDEVWSICVTFRRIFGASSDYCIPSPRHPPSKVLIQFNGDNEVNPFMVPDFVRDDQQLSSLRGEYLEKGLPQCLLNWHQQARDQTVNLRPINRNGDEPDDITLDYYRALPSMVTIEPKVFEKLILHQNAHGMPQNERIWDQMYGVDLMLVNRFVIHHDAHWHIDRVQIGNERTFHVTDTVMYNPTEITTDIPSVQMLVKRIKMRDPAVDKYSEFHVFKVDDEALRAMMSGDGAELDYFRSIAYRFESSLFLKGDLSHEDRSNYYKRDAAKKRVIYMERDGNEHFQPRWEVRKRADDECLCRASMNKPLHHKTSWDIVPKSDAVAPVMFIDEIEVRINGNNRASGTYKLTTNPFQIGYFAQYDPDSYLIFVKQRANPSESIYRLFMAKAPDNQWYIQRFDSQQIAINRCRLSLGNQAGNEDASLCTHVVPHANWRGTDSFLQSNPQEDSESASEAETDAEELADDASDSQTESIGSQEAFDLLRAKSVEFSYGADRIHSIFLKYSRQIGAHESLHEGHRVEHKNSISLKKEILIKGNDIYFKMFTPKDDNNLDRYYNQIVLDMTSFNAMTNVEAQCIPAQGALPRIHLQHYEGKVEAIGGMVHEGTFTITFHHQDDCLNFKNTVKLYSQPISFL